MNLLLFQPGRSHLPRQHPSGVPVVHAAHGDAAVAARAGHGPLGMLLATQFLHDGELVLLILKPSIWFILLSTLRFAAGVLILLISIILLDDQIPGSSKSYIEAAILVLVGRLMWAVLQWMGRLYILTDMRIVRLSGVFTVNLFDCPLRKVARTRVFRSMRERIFRLGSIEIIPADEKIAPGVWQTIAHPYEIHEQIVAAINRAKQGRIVAA